MLNEKIKALIFDCDGTLVDNMPLHYVSWSQTLSKYGLAFEEERFYKFAGKPTVDIIELLAREQNISVDAPKVSEEKDSSYHDMEDEVQEMTKVMDLVRELHGVYPMSVGSGSTTKSVEATLRRLELSKYFDYTVCKDDVSQPKPNPETFLKAADLMKVKPESCVVFEDGVAGMEAAKTAGMFVIDIVNENPREKLFSF